MKTTKKVRNFSQHLPAAIDKCLTREELSPVKEVFLRNCQVFLTSLSCIKAPINLTIRMLLCQSMEPKCTN